MAGLTFEHWAHLVAWALAAAGGLLVVWALWGARPRGSVRCPKCWYDMKSIAEAGRLVCPECGHDAKHKRRLHKRRRRWSRAVIGALAMLASSVVYRAEDGVQRGWAGLVPTPLLAAMLPTLPSHDRNGTPSLTTGWYAQTLNKLSLELDHRMDSFSEWYGHEQEILLRVAWWTHETEEAWLGGERSLVYERLLYSCIADLSKHRWYIEACLRDTLWSPTIYVEGEPIRVRFDAERFPDLFGRYTIKVFTVDDKQEIARRNLHIGPHLGSFLPLGSLYWSDATRAIPRSEHLDDSVSLRVVLTQWVFSSAGDRSGKDITLCETIWKQRIRRVSDARQALVPIESDEFEAKLEEWMSGVEITTTVIRPSDDIFIASGGTSLSDVFQTLPENSTLGLRFELLRNKELTASTTAWYSSSMLGQSWVFGSGYAPWNTWYNWIQDDVRDYMQIAEQHSLIRAFEPGDRFELRVVGDPAVVLRADTPTTYWDGQFTIPLQRITDHENRIRFIGPENRHYDANSGNP